MLFVTTRAYTRCPSALRSQTSTTCQLSRTQTTLSSCGAGCWTQTLSALRAALGQATIAATASTNPIRLHPRAPIRTGL